MLFQKHIQIKGIIHCYTGLHIGGSEAKIEIGGAVDSYVIKHSLTNQPYIPGSSLKGKLRSLLEAKQTNYQWEGKDQRRVKTEKDPCGCGECDVCRIFGPHKNQNHSLGPTRLLVRDAMLTEEWQTKFRQTQESGGIFFEEKTENIINRSTRAAENPRTQERVPAGAEFDFRLTLRLFQGDNETEMLARIAEGLRLLEADYLGGSGSRGYGQVEFRNLTRDGQAWDWRGEGKS